jgi:riboflavin synthase
VFHRHKLDLGPRRTGVEAVLAAEEPWANFVRVEHKSGCAGYGWLVFTGIVRERGRLESSEAGGGNVRLRIRAPETAAGTGVGDSVAVNGVCLTAVAVGDGVIAFDVVPETLRRSSLGALEPCAPVNVEPALRAGEPLGGHLVQGHVDAIGRVRRVDEEGLEIEAGPEILRYCVEKGSIAIEGVSLTIARLGEDSFEVALVPHTREVTTLGAARPGDELNLEVDLVGKHVERLLARGALAAGPPGYDQ